MTRAESLAAEIRGYCGKHADAKAAGKYARYFREGYDSWGLLDKDHEIWNGRQEEWYERYRGMGLRGFLKLGEILFRSGKYEEGALAIRILAKFDAEMDKRVLPGLAKWFEAGIGNWAHVDSVCALILGPAIAGGAIPFSALKSWRGSKLKYQRRAVPVALLGLVKKGADARPLLEFLRPMMADQERVVHQGLGWFLREAWKRQPKPVEAFLLEHKETAARLIFQYATEKMTARERERFRRTKGR